MQFNREFLGCKDGDIYPTEFHPGDECPPELLDAAISMGAVDPEPAAKPAKAKKAAQEA